MEIRNAKITSTNLGMQYTDHGILSFYIHLDYGGTRQGFGGLALDNVNPAYKVLRYDDLKKKDTPIRIPTDLAAGLLLAIDVVFKCDWEKLPSLSCRSYCTHTHVRALGHYLEDKWLWLKEKEGEFAFVVTTFDEIEERN